MANIESGRIGRGVIPGVEGNTLGEQHPPIKPTEQVEILVETPIFVNLTPANPIPGITGPTQSA